MRARTLRTVLLVCVVSFIAGNQVGASIGRRERILIYPCGISKIGLPRVVECILIGDMPKYEYADRLGTGNFIEISPKQNSLVALRENRILSGNSDQPLIECFGKFGSEPYSGLARDLIGWRLTEILYPNYSFRFVGSIRYTKFKMPIENPDVGAQLSLRGILHRFEGVASSSGLNFGSIGRILRSIGGDLGVVQTFADEPQLPKEKTELKTADNDQAKGEYRLRGRRALPPSFLLVLLGAGLLSFSGALGLGWLMLSPNRERNRKNCKGPQHKKDWSGGSPHSRSPRNPN